MEKDAAQFEGQEEPKQEPTERIQAPVDPRAAAIEAIVDRRREEMVADGVLQPKEENTDEGQETQAERSETPLLEQEKPKEEPVYSIKVNGQERKVSQSELIALAQKGYAADEKFMTAAEMKKQAEELFLKSQSVDAKAQQAQSSDGKAAPKPSVSDEELAEKLYSGDTKQVAEAMAILRNQAAEEAITRHRSDAEQRRQAVVQTQLAEGYTAFKEAYPEIEENSPAWGLADWYTQQVYEEAKTKPGTYKTMGEVLIEAGRRTVEQLGLRKEPPKVDTASRVEKKRAASSSQPPTAGGRVTTREPESASVLPSEAARSKAIQDIAKSRGQRIA